MKLIAKAIDGLAGSMRELSRAVECAGHDYSQDIGEAGTSVERGCVEIAEALGELGIRRQAG
jgi:hypothetical protein